MLVSALTVSLAIAAGPSPPVELIGAEYMPAWLRTESASNPSPRANLGPGAGVLRLASFTWGRFAWTAGVAGLGLADWGARPTRFFFLGSEPGFVAYNHGPHRLLFAVGLGVGIFDYADDARGTGEAPPYIGFAWSPTMRYSYRLGRNLAFGAGLRALTRTPSKNSPGGLLGAFVHVGWSVPRPKRVSRERAGLEVIALELMPWWIQSQRPSSWNPEVTILPGAAIFRLATLKWMHVYWTPFVTGGGFTLFGSDEITILLFLATEVGGFVIKEEGHTLRIGLAAGGGFFTAFSGGGRGLILSPTMRYGYQVHPNFFIGVGLRGFTVLPNTNSAGAMGGLFFDVGWSVIP